MTYVEALEAALADTGRRLDALRRAVRDAAVLRATCAEGRHVHVREQDWDCIVALAARFDARKESAGSRGD